MNFSYQESSDDVLPSTRPTLYGTRHAISAGHYLAAAAGFAILEAGGNAVDAGCAAGMALTVVQPDIVNFAGVAPIILRMANGEVETIAGLGHWPASFPPDLFMRSHGGQIPSGVLGTVVPAAPDAWITALKRHGTMSFGDVAAGAIHLAANGFAVHDGLAKTCRIQASEFQRWPENARHFVPGGVPMKAGDRFRQTDLAATIQYMVDEERACKSPGRDAGLEAARSAFYKGDIAHTIADFMKREGGYLSYEDMAGYHSAIEPAVRRFWRGHEVMTCGPWCQGPTLTTALLMVEKFGIDGLAHNSPEYLHVLIEALKLAFADREHYYGDPNFVNVPLDALLSDERIARRVALIARDRAMPGMPDPEAGGPSGFPASGHALPTIENDTSYVCTVDRWGNAFSATPSDSSWNSPMVPGLGIVPSIRGVQSRPDPSHPSGLAPLKRPRLTPSPALLVTKQGGVMPLGTPGGDVQTQAMLQVILNVLHFDMSLQAAIEAPRVATYSFPSSFTPFDYFPGRIAVERRIDPTVIAGLEQLGHQVKLWPAWAGLAGSVEVIRTDPASGLIASGADPRRPAYAITI
ncbi:MAG: gamma-glutamyltransferase [Polaromonas sp.]|nr:gamma-glutamyltransferase [Polaromonas sp.]